MPFNTVAASSLSDKDDAQDAQLATFRDQLALVTKAFSNFV